MTRRRFVATASSLAAAPLAGQNVPWYQRVHRWGQTNITEIDPDRYDLDFWRGYWRETSTQGIIVNAGGIVAYYPSRFPLHRRAKGLGDRDLFGDVLNAARSEGLVVLARMDSSRASAEFYRAHPDWFAQDRQGRPFPAAENFTTCINGPYYNQYLPEVLKEIIERYHPEGFGDNSWAGLSRDQICYCRNCHDRFRKETGEQLPSAVDWNDPVYRGWISWGYQRRLETWDMNNRVTRGAGGPDCLWLGMIGGDIAGQSRTFRDVREICRRTPIVLLDHQHRGTTGGFHSNVDAGLRLHGVLGWDKAIPESMPMYQMGGSRSFRLSAKPAAEARMWMTAGFAGGIQPWWHHIAAFHEDRRAYRTAAPVIRWFKDNEDALLDRRPMARVGIVWSQRNVDFYGRDNASALTEAPVEGMVEALIHARIPYLFVHADDLASVDLDLMILPELAVMTVAQCKAVMAFVERGGGLLSTGRTSLYDESGQLHQDFALADVLGVHRAGAVSPSRAGYQHSYLRITTRHGVLAGFEDTNILPYGGGFDPLKVDADRTVPLTYIPPFPIFPPESSYMNPDRTNHPGLVLGTKGKGRVAYLAADIDRRLSQDHLPDHARLLRNLVDWASHGPQFIDVEGPGTVGVYPYTKNRKIIVHLLNWNFAEAWRAPVDEIPPIGPYRVRLKTTPKQRARLLVAAREIPLTTRDGWAVVDIPSVAEHEVVVLD